MQQATGRHLVRERSGDKLELNDEDDLHSSDTVQEKLSLVYRFGGSHLFWGSGEKGIPEYCKSAGREKWN